jgi:hypothetical protein
MNRDEGEEGGGGERDEKEERKRRRRRKKKKRWNSVVYPVIYNWKLGTAARPKAICRFHPGEFSPPLPSGSCSLPKVIRPSTGIDARFGDSFLRLRVSVLLFPFLFFLLFPPRARRLRFRLRSLSLSVFVSRNL